MRVPRRHGMNNRFLRTFIAAITTVCVCWIASAQAVQITGGITMGGAATADSGNLTLATHFLSFGSPIPVTTSSASGSYVGLGGDTNICLPFFWNPPSTPVSNLWSFTVGPTTYSFDLASLTVTNGNIGPMSFLDLSATGTARITGFDPTPANWSLTAVTAGNSTFSFNSSIVAIPEPSAVVLVGTGLLGLLAFPRRPGSIIPKLQAFVSTRHDSGTTQLSNRSFAQCIIHSTSLLRLSVMIRFSSAFQVERSQSFCRSSVCVNLVILRCFSDGRCVNQAAPQSDIFTLSTRESRCLTAINRFIYCTTLWEYDCYTIALEIFK